MKMKHHASKLLLAMNKKLNHPNDQAYINTGQDSANQQDAGQSGNFSFGREVKVDFSKRLIDKYDSSQSKDDIRQERKYRLDKITLGVGILYAAFAAIQSCTSISGLGTAKESLISVQRAFVFPTGKIETILDPDGKTPVGQKFWIIWENSGTTPAIKFMVHNNFVPMRELPENFPFRDIGNADDRMTYLPPKGTVLAMPRSLNFDQLNQIYQGRMNWFLYGWVRYYDVFDGTSQHITKYCYEVAVHPNYRSGDTVNLEAEMVACPRNNCADDGCAVL